jgi:predicted amidohydrolase YtcJ
MCELGLDVAVINANVITVDSKMSRAEAVGIIGDKIAAVGPNDEIKKLTCKHTKIIDAGGKPVVPGFCDSHMHPLLYGHFAGGVKLMDVKSIPEFLERVKEKVKETPKGEMILGFGWNQENMEEKRFPTRWEVDEVAPDNPCFLIHYNAHIYLINTALMEEKGITENTPAPPGGEIVKNEKGEPTGVLLENCINLIAPGFLETGAGLFTFEQSKDALKLAADDAVTWGLTSIMDVLVGDAQVKAYQQLDREGELAPRVNFQIAFELLDELVNLGIESGFGNSKVRFNGIKLILDGSLSSRTGALREPYADDPSTKGIMRHTPEFLKEVVYKAYANGIRVDIHALGDGANEVVLDVFKYVDDELHPVDPRYKISHCLILGEDLIEKYKDLAIVASVQPVFGMKGQYWAPRLVGPERIHYSHAWKRLDDAGIHMASGTDAPIETMNPLMNVYAAVTRKDPDGNPPGGWRPDQKLSVETALKMVTIEGAYATGEEDVKGSIEVGKFADLVMLSDDPFEVEPDAIKDISALWTMVDGEIVYEK